MPSARKPVRKTNATKQNKIHRLISAFNPRSLKGGMALFALVFAIGGAGVFLYSSFAASNHIIGQVPCGSTNNFNGNSYTVKKDGFGVNHYTSPLSPNYEIILYCGRGGLGQLEYRNMATGSKRILYARDTGIGYTFGVGNIGIYPLPNKGFAVAIMERWSDFNGYYYTGTEMQSYDVHGASLKTANGPQSGIASFPYITKFLVTKLSGNGTYTVDGVANFSDGHNVTWRNGVATYN